MIAASKVNTDTLSEEAKQVVGDRPVFNLITGHIPEIAELFINACFRKWFGFIPSREVY
ncbi:hypothetical protein Psfp_03808 [Pelotomaculum sp. FP]|uniref:hypothetical protein n=1 Tax=Pelotomaculum sp. FP TaxID=261474 RepID=UPI0010FFDB2E|nr:hypothetical protein [Pelotomaculum sp. FP]TEB12128.1 hypothetical protein Psfp_03808 [Pelotomaculum sp. FP]